MINLIPVKADGVASVYKKMTDAFPYEERRDISDQAECLENKYFRWFEVSNGEELVGFISLWDFDEFVYIEHLAMDAQKRSGGYGSKTVEYIKKLYNKPIILEAEAPVTEQQIKRIRFYDRLGFKINGYDYVQPSYHSDSQEVPLKILSYPELISQAEFDLFVKRTREYPYKKYV